MRTVLACLAVLLVAAPAALAQSNPVGGDGSEIELTRVAVPALVVAEKPFPVEVEVTSHLDEDQEVMLFGALYEIREGEGPCGPATSDRFKSFTHMIQPHFVVEPGERHPYPEPDDDLPWRHKIAYGDAPPQEGEMELCIFVGDAEEQKVTYFDYETLRIRVRQANEPPQVDFTWTPEEANITTPFTFTASATDPEGDDLEYRWDFGYYGAKGRARATGEEVQHAFYPDGEYTVALTVTDGFDGTTVSHVVRVLPENVATPLDVDPKPDRARSLLPAPGFAAAFVLASGVALLTGRHRRGAR